MDSGKDVNEKLLVSFTGSAERVFAYDRNSDFAMKILQLASAQPWDCEIRAPLQPGSIPLRTAAVRKTFSEEQTARDLAASLDGNVDKDVKVGSTFPS